ncbi:MAG: segregation and condensation protein segregation and condensation protein [Candidatus Parcubacteria bacterium]|jgi:segregation and condensation protein B
MPSDEQVQLSVEQKIEAILFWKGEPTTIKELSKFLGFNEQSIIDALKDLEESLKHRGIVLQQKGTGHDIEVQLGTSAAASALIEQITKDELSKDLGKAALETLAIILYKGPLKRSEIDYIRGVNSTFIIRNLLIRGLIEKQPSPGDQRTMVYSSSFELLSHLGVAKVEDLPDFASVQEEIKKFKETNQELSHAPTDGQQPAEQAQESAQ